MKKKKNKMMNLNYKQKIVIRLTLFILAFIFLIINLNSHGGFVPNDTLVRGSNFENTIINDMLINKKGIKFKVEEPIEFRSCKILKENNKVNKDILCVLPTTTQIGYLVFKNKDLPIEEYYTLRLSQLDIDATHNFEEAKELDELVFNKAEMYYTLSTSYIMNNNSSDLLGDFPALEELENQIKLDKIFYLKNNKQAYNQELMMLNVNQDDFKRQLNLLKEQYQKTKTDTKKEAIVVQIDEIEKKIEVLNKIIERYKILEELGIMKSIRGN